LEILKNNSNSTVHEHKQISKSKQQLLLAKLGIIGGNLILAMTRWKAIAQHQKVGTHLYVAFQMILNDLIKNKKCPLLCFIFYF
jgi:hypothetical protein